MFDYNKAIKIYEPEFVEEVMKDNGEKAKEIIKLKTENEARTYTIDLQNDIIKAQREKIDELKEVLDAYRATTVKMEIELDELNQYIWKMNKGEGYYD